MQNISTNHIKSQSSSCQSFNVINIKYLNKYCRNLPRVRKTILKELLYFNKKYLRAFPSQKLIAQKVGCSRQYVNETISEFVSTGILLKTNLNWRSCLYELHPYLYSIEFRRKCDLLLQSDINVSKKKTTPIILPLLISFTNNTTLLHNVDTSTYVESSNQRKKERKKGRKVMSATIEKITTELALDSYEVSELLTFSEEVLKKAYTILKSKGKVDNKFGYLRGICRKLTTSSNVATKPNVGSGSVKREVKEEKPVDRVKSLEVDVKKYLHQKAMRSEEITELLDSTLQYKKELLESAKEQLLKNPTDTPVKLANDISKLMNSEALTNLASFMGISAATNCRDITLRNHLLKPLTFTGEVGEDIAIQMINKYRDMYKLPHILNENKESNTNPQREENNAPTVKFDSKLSEMNIYDEDDFEEVLD